MMHERIVVLAVLYGAETWNLNIREKRKLNVIEMKKIEKEYECKLICQGEQ